MIVQATQANIAAVWKTLKDGDTLQLIGRFDGWRPSTRSFSPDNPLTVDASQAVLSNCYASASSPLVGINWHSLHIEGGPLISRGLRIDAGSDMTFVNPNLDGKGVVGVGLWLSGLARVTVTGLTSVGFLRAMTLGCCSDFKVTGFDISGFGADAIDVTSCQDGLIDDGDIHDSAIVSGAHPDAVQLASPSGAPRCARVTISNLRINGHMQGVNLFNSVSMGQLGGEEIAVLNVAIAVDHMWAVCFQDVDRGRIENAQISTLPGSPAQAIIGVEYHDPAAVDTVERWGNVIAAFGSKPAIIDPVRPPPPAPTPVVRAPTDVLADLVTNEAAGSKLLAELQAAIAAAA